MYDASSGPAATPAPTGTEGPDMKRTGHLVIVAAITAMVIASPAAAQVELRFTPPGQHIAVDGAGSLSVLLDETLDVRTIELWVSYDETVVEGLGGQPGQLFTGSGCMLFPIFEEDSPGAWYAGAVTMGPTCFVTGPGELYRWNFEGLADGICHVRVDSLVLYDPLAEIIGGVSLSGTTILVGDVTSADTVPGKRLGLSLAPNPFNPRTVVSLCGQPGEIVTLEIFDLGGRRIVTPWHVTLSAQRTTLQWNGIDQQGQSVPGGTYLFRVSDRGGQRVTQKGILLK